MITIHVHDGYGQGPTTLIHLGQLRKHRNFESTKKKNKKKLVAHENETGLANDEIVKASLNMNTPLVMDYMNWMRARVEGHRLVAKLLEDVWERG